MSSLKITVCMKEKDYARLLARGLAEQGYGMEVRVADSRDYPFCGPEDGHQVLVTDFSPKDGLRTGFEAQKGIIILGEEAVSAGELCRQILRMAEGEGRHQPFKNPDSTSAAAFYSRRGGCGVTSICLTCGRMLAGAYGEKVLYLPLTEDDGSRIYRDCKDDTASCGQGNARELLYRMRTGMRWKADGYGEPDFCGLFFLKDVEGLTVAERLELAEKLAEEGDFDRILMDFGSGAAAADWGQIQKEKGKNVFLIEVKSRRDLRCQTDREEDDGRPGCLQIWNHTAAENHGPADILHDEESFLLSPDGRGIDLVMSKSFAIGVKKLAEILLDRAANDVETDGLPSDYAEGGHLPSNYGRI